MIVCLCGHEVHAHDSGGCCRENFCPCHTWRPQTKAPLPIVEFRLEQAVCALTAPAPPSAPSLADFQIETASYADLAKWAYKARDFIRNISAV